MEIIYFLKGVAVGFSLAVPIGPIGILCLRRTLLDGARRGIRVGLGAASADIIYATVAVFGVSIVYDFIDSQQHLIRVIGGILLLIIGARTLLTHPKSDPPSGGNGWSGHEFLSIVLLALTNPLTLFGFAAVLSGLGIKGATSTVLSLLSLLAGVFLGSLLWFLLITAIARFFKEKLSARGLALVNRIAGSLIVGIGVIALWSGLTGQ